jgi:hypothetical protein
MRSEGARFTRQFVGSLALLVFAGCGGGDKSTAVVPPADGLPAGTPMNDSPLPLLARSEATFEAESNGEYAKLLTDDFRFHFSAQSDPALVSEYPGGWARADEEIAVTHLFNGFTNSEATLVPGASRIDVSLNGIQVADDTSHVDSTAHYRKLVVSGMEMVIEVPTASEPVTYTIYSRQEFYVVRGDAAVLASGQPAQSDRWYIRRWDDLSISLFSRKGPVINPASPKTLGSIKNQYR